MTKTYFGHLQKLPRTQTPPFLQHDTPLDAPEKKNDHITVPWSFENTTLIYI